MIKYRKLEKADKMLNGALELREFIKMRRISHLISKVWLNHRQRQSVPFFKRFSVRTTEELLNTSSFTSSDDQHRGRISTNKIADECNPVDDPIDRRILYELTDLKVNSDDYKDDSSIHEDELEHEADDPFAKQRKPMKSGRSRKAVSSSDRSSVFTKRICRVSNGEFHINGNTQLAGERKGHMTIN